MSSTDEIYSFEDVTVDVGRFRVRKAGSEVGLTPRAFDVLLVLLRNRGHVVEKQVLFDQVWKDTFVSDNALTKVIKEIRQVIGDDAANPKYIETLTKRGYRFIAELRPAITDEVKQGDVQWLIPQTAPPAKSHSRWLLLVAVLGFVSLVFGTVALVKMRTQPEPDASPIDSIAVLPFVNEGGGESLEYLCDGMTESLINGLSQISGFSVKARSTVYRYKNRNTPPQQAGAELNVKGVLIGRVVQHGDDLSLFLSLVNVATGNQIWGEQYHRKQADLITLQNEIARDVTNKLRLKLSRADQRRIDRNYTTSPEAYRAFLQGRFYWNKRTPKDLQKSVDYFQQAASADRNYALAYSGLADAYSQLANYGGAAPREAMPKAKEAVLKALSLDDSLAEPHTALGFILMVYDYDFAGAEREFKRALQLNPNYSIAHLYYAELLMYLGRFPEAETEYQRALEVDPLSLIINRMYGESLMYARKYDETINQLKKTLELDANFASARYSLSAVYQLRGNYAESVEEFAKSQELIGAPERASLARSSFAAGGWAQYLRAMATERNPVAAATYNRAVFYLALGAKEKAIAELERAYDAREHFLIWIKVDPRLDPLRDDPRFQSLRQRAGL